MEKPGGLILSSAAHAGLAGIVLFVFGDPRPFEAAAERAITVDVMTQQEAAQEQTATQEQESTQKQDTTQKQAADKQALNEKQTAMQSKTTPAGRQAPQQQPLKQSDPKTDKQPGDELPSIDAGELLPTYNLRVPTEIDARTKLSPPAFRARKSLG